MTAVFLDPFVGFSSYHTTTLERWRRPWTLRPWRCSGSSTDSSLPARGKRGWKLSTTWPTAKWPIMVKVVTRAKLPFCHSCSQYHPIQRAGRWRHRRSGAWPIWRSALLVATVTRGNAFLARNLRYRRWSLGDKTTDTPSHIYPTNLSKWTP